MTTYKFFSDYIVMVATDSNKTFIKDSDSDIQFILTCLRAHLLNLYSTSLYYSSLLTKVYRLLDDIIALCDIPNIRKLHIIKLVRSLLEIMPEHTFKDFRYVIID